MIYHIIVFLWPTIFYYILIGYFYQTMNYFIKNKPISYIIISGRLMIQYTPHKSAIYDYILIGYQSQILVNFYLYKPIFYISIQAD